MNSEKTLQEIKKLVSRLESMYEEFKKEVKEELAESVMKQIREGDSEASKRTIDKLEELKNFEFQTNIDAIESMANRMKSKEKDGTPEYDQIKLELERKQEKINIENDFFQALEKRGAKIESVGEEVVKLNHSGESKFFFEYDKNKNLNDEIDSKLKYSSLIIGAKTIEGEKEIKEKIDNWLLTKSNSKTILKYVDIHITSIERLSTDMEFSNSYKVS